MLEERPWRPRKHTALSITGQFKSVEAVNRGLVQFSPPQSFSSHLVKPEKHRNRELLLWRNRFRGW